MRRARWLAAALLLGCSAEVLECYQHDECARGTYCTAQGRCVEGARPLDAGPDRGMPDPDRGLDPAEVGPPIDAGVEVGADRRLDAHDLGDTDAADEGVLDQDPPDGDPDMVAPDMGQPDEGLEPLDAGPDADPLACQLVACTPLAPPPADDDGCPAGNPGNQPPNRSALARSGATVLRAWVDDYDGPLRVSCVDPANGSNVARAACLAPADTFNDRASVFVAPAAQGWWAAWSHDGAVQLAAIGADCRPATPGVVPGAQPRGLTLASTPDGRPLLAWNTDGGIAVSAGGPLYTRGPREPGYVMAEPLLIPPRAAGGDLWLLFNEVLLDDDRDLIHALRLRLVGGTLSVPEGEHAFIVAPGDYAVAARNANVVVAATVDTDRGGEPDELTVAVIRGLAEVETHSLGAISTGVQVDVTYNAERRHFAVVWADPNQTLRYMLLDAWGRVVGHSSIECGPGPLEFPAVAAELDGRLLVQFRNEVDRHLNTVRLSCE